MIIKASDYSENEIMRFIRESTGKTQKEFGSDIGKSKDWVQSNELGRSEYKFKDLKKLAKANNIEIYIMDKSETPVFYKVKKQSKEKENVVSIPN